MIFTKEFLEHIREYKGPEKRCMHFLHLLQANHKDITLVGDKKQIIKGKRFLFVLSTDDMDTWSSTTEIGIFVGKIDLGSNTNKKQFQIEYSGKEGKGSRSLSMWKEGVFILIVDMDVENMGFLEKEIEGMEEVRLTGSHNEENGEYDKEKGEESDKGKYVDFNEIHDGRIYMGFMGNEELFRGV